MTFSVKMPALGESVTEGTVTRWLKAEGDHIALDEPLLEVSTDKVDTEIPSPAAGVLQKILVAVDSVAPVGAELAIIADSANVASTPAAPVAARVAPPTPPVQAAPVQAAPVQAAAPQVSGSGTSVVMPALGESVTEGTVTRWLKKVGDNVVVDEPLLEVSTDKVDTEIPSPASGVLLSIDVPVDSTVAVGTKLASIGATGSSAPIAAPAAVAPVSTTPKAVPTPPQTPPPLIPKPAPAAPIPTSSGQRTSVLDDSYVTPIVRKLAAENGVDLSRDFFLYYF